MDVLTVLITVGILGAALVALVRGSDVFVEGAQALGLRVGMPPFVVGVLIVGLGTSLPELASSLASVWQGEEQIVLANVVGSNITNILFIGGVLAVWGGPLMLRKNLLTTELPLFVIATVHFVLIILDGVVTLLEGGLLLGTLAAYIWYLLRNDDERVEAATPDQVTPTLGRYDALTLVLAGGLATMLGAHYTIEALITLATSLGIAVSVLSIVLIALGTSLPELAVSIQAVRSGETEMAIGNIFGSNAFNILLVAGASALVTPLTAAPVVAELGLAVLVAASVMWYVSGTARQFMPWEGLMLLLFYGFFLVQLAQFV